MCIANVAPMCRPFVIVVDMIDWTWLCSWIFVMSLSPSSTGSSSVDPSLLSPPTSTPVPSSYSQSTRNYPVTPPPTTSIPTSTPISNKTSGMHGRDSANYRLAQETSDLFLGAKPPPENLNMFLPISQDTPQCPNSKGAFTSVSSANKEVDMYAPSVSKVLRFSTYCALPTFNR